MLGSYGGFGPDFMMHRVLLVGTWLEQRGSGLRETFCCWPAAPAGCFPLLLLPKLVLLLMSSGNTLWSGGCMEIFRIPRGWPWHVLPFTTSDPASAGLLYCGFFSLARFALPSCGWQRMFKRSVRIDPWHQCPPGLEVPTNLALLLLDGCAQCLVLSIKRLFCSKQLFDDCAQRLVLSIKGKCKCLVYHLIKSCKLVISIAYIVPNISNWSS